MFNISDKYKLQWNKVKPVATNYKLINLIKMTKRILEILDNVRYWETCPIAYKQDIETFLNSENKQLDLPVVVKSLPTNRETALKIREELINEHYKNDPNKNTFALGFITCFDWLDRMCKK